METELSLCTIIEVACLAVMTYVLIWLCMQDQEAMENIIWLYVYFRMNLTFKIYVWLIAVKALA